MADSPLAQYASVGLAVLGAAAAVWTRFVVIEERQANQLTHLVRLSDEVSALRDRINTLERGDPHEVERLHEIELRLNRVEDHVGAVTVRRRRR